MKELDDLHWDEKRKIYSDYGLTLDQPSDNVKLRFITHIGYSSIFPVLFNVIPPNSPKLGYLLKHISDRNGLWSSHGLRSLSKRDKKNIHHFKDDNIWSGPVHLSINYLALRSLKYYSAANGPYSLIATNLYTKLRNMVISTILNSYADTNQLWLYYDSESGQGMVRLDGVYT
jgi:mannosyl-oligosaccharide glucosidase